MDRLPTPRRFHAYGVGMAKSGTHFLAAIFVQYRAVHEPQYEQVLRVILEAADGALTVDRQIAFLTRRDRELQLEMDASQLNYFFLAQLVEAFPCAKFILTIRDCYSWLDSLINHQLGRSASPDWIRLRDLRFGGGPCHGVEEQVLAENGLYTLDGYFSYWATHNRQVLETVPSQRLMVLRTGDLQRSLPKLAGFLAIPVETLQSSAAPAFQVEKRFGILQQLNPHFLHAKAAKHCGALMGEYFPSIDSLDDALAARS